jgi:hypothetical protein
MIEVDTARDPRPRSTTTSTFKRTEQAGSVAIIVEESGLEVGAVESAALGNKQLYWMALTNTAFSNEELRFRDSAGRA